MGMFKMNDIRYTVTFGHKTARGDALPFARVENARVYALGALARLLGGANATDLRGAWVNSEGTTIVESATAMRAIFTHGDPDAADRGVESIARAIASMLDQESVMVEKERVNCAFLSPM